MSAWYLILHNFTRDKKYSIQDGFQFQFLAQFRLMKQKLQEQTIKLRYLES